MIFFEVFQIFEFDPEIMEVFIDEFNSLLLILETEMNKAANKKEVNIKEIFRVFHTLKGNSATLEFNRLQKLTNAFCDYFRSKQNVKNLSLQEIISLEKCFSALNRFAISIKNGRKGKRIKIQSVINSLDIKE